MTDQEAADRLQRMWQRAEAHQQSLSERFYTHLFAAIPAARALFHGDMQMQHTKFAMSIDFLIASLRDGGTLPPGAVDLGNRHTAYGVVQTYYDAAGDALSRAFEDVIGAPFADEDARALSFCFDKVKSAMLGGAEARDA